MPPIILYAPRTTYTIDEEGVPSPSTVGPPPELCSPGPYYDYTSSHYGSETTLPSLRALCIRHLVANVEQIHPWHGNLANFPSLSRGQARDVDLAYLLPAECNADSAYSLDKVDPRLWATIVQTYHDLPEVLRSYSIALSDRHLPLIQSIPSTDHFSLVTILSLPGSKELTDETIKCLKPLAGLSALDASRTSLSALGVRRLATMLGWSDGEGGAPDMRLGPWQLRVLRLCGCLNIDNAVFSPCRDFPLLSVIDVRDTKCRCGKPRDPRIPESYFDASDNKRLGYDDLHTVLDELERYENTFSSDNRFVLNIDRASYVSPKPRVYRRESKPNVAQENRYTVIPRAGNISTGNAESLERWKREREAEERHEANLMAFRERNADLGIREDWVHHLEDDTHDVNPFDSDGESSMPARRQCYDDPEHECSSETEAEELGREYIRNGGLFGGDSDMESDSPLDTSIEVDGEDRPPLRLVGGAELSPVKPTSASATRPIRSSMAARPLRRTLVQASAFRSASGSSSTLTNRPRPSSSTSHTSRLPAPEGFAAQPKTPTVKPSRHMQDPTAFQATRPSHDVSRPTRSVPTLEPLPRPPSPHAPITVRTVPLPLHSSNLDLASDPPEEPSSGVGTHRRTSHSALADWFVHNTPLAPEPKPEPEPETAPVPARPRPRLSSHIDHFYGRNLPHSSPETFFRRMGDLASHATNEASSSKSTERETGPLLFREPPPFSLILAPRPRRVPSTALASDEPAPVNRTSSNARQEVVRAQADLTKRIRAIHAPDGFGAGASTQPAPLPPAQSRNPFSRVPLSRVGLREHQPADEKPKKNISELVVPLPPTTRKRRHSVGLAASAKKPALDPALSVVAPPRDVTPVGFGIKAPSFTAGIREREAKKEVERKGAKSSGKLKTSASGRGGGSTVKAKAPVKAKGKTISSKSSSASLHSYFSKAS